MDEEFTSGLRLRAASPDVPPGFVRRERLDRLLTQGVTGPVTLLSAGPGFGKTLAVAAWVQTGNTPGPVAWLAADDSDDPQGFWTNILGSLTLADALPHDSALRGLRPARDFGAPEMAQIVAGFGQLPAPVVLVLDDLHRITDARVLTSLTQLLDHQPEQLRLVLVTRAEPALGLRRRHLSGSVTEIRADALAFTEPETRALCARSGVDLSPVQAATLWDRTEGWPAGLRLVLLGLDPHDLETGLQRVTGHRHSHLVAGYLVEEVLEQLPPTDRRFLLATSIVEQVNADLARTLTGRPDSHRALESLVARNALTVRLLDRPDWFRYHPLLRHLLQERLLAEQPDSVPDLHRRAADWHTKAGDPITALEHHARAHDWPALTRLLGAVALPLVLTPHATELVAALAPAYAQAGRHPSADTLLAAAVCEFKQCDYESMRRDTDDADALLTAHTGPVEPTSRILLAVLRTAYARTHDPADLVERAEDLIATVDRMPRDQLPAKDGYAVIAANNKAIGLLLSGDVDIARAELLQVRTRAHRTGMGLVELAASSHLSLVDVVLGQLPDARRATTTALDLAQRRGWTREPQALAIYAAAALTHIAVHELDHAEEWIALGRTARHPNTDAGARLILEIAAVTTTLARRDAYAARGAERRLRAAQNESGRLPPMLHRWIRVTYAEVALATGGEPATILTAISDPGADTGYAAGLERIVRAKAHLAAKQPATAIETLDAPVRFAASRTVATEAALLSAIAATHLRRDAAALDHVTEAITLAQPVGLVAPFVAAGPRVATLLDRYRHIVGDHPAFTRTLATACAITLPDTRTAGPVTLTERELAVLRYLPTMFKTSEIAADLFVSVNTVKTHQQAIYRKLGVTTRRDAVTRAREFGLL
ncbi:MAG TPA: LuxR C-terminal-related transcriptional regulator [Aldersonia sp.]